MCPEAAKNLIENDDRFEVICPLVNNSDIFVIKDTNKLKKIAITKNRFYQQKIIEEKYGKYIKIYPIIYSSLPYVLEKGTVDGIIIDSIKAINLNGIKEPVKEDKIYTTYVLVVKKDFKNDKKYRVFVDNYNKSINELNNKETLRMAMEDFKKIKLSDKDVEEWLKLKVKLLPISLKKKLK